MDNLYDPSEELGIQIQFPEFVDIVEKKQFFTWVNGHLASKIHLFNAEKRSAKGFIHRDISTGDVKFELQIEYFNLNALDDMEIVLELVRQL